MSDREQRQLDDLIAHGPDSPLGRALRAAEDERPLPQTARVDAVLMREARQPMPFATRRPLVWRIGVPLAAAAAVAMAASVVFWNTQGDVPRAPVVAGDIDRSGRVDILDAYILARMIENAESLPAAEQGADANADGVVDARDVELLAMQIVSLEGGRG